MQRAEREQRYRRMADEGGLHPHLPGPQAAAERSAVAEIVGSGPPADKPNDTPGRAQSRAIKAALAAGLRGGVPLSAVASDLATAKFDRAALIDAVRNKLRRLDGGSEADDVRPEAVARVRADIAGWLDMAEGRAPVKPGELSHF